MVLVDGIKVGSATAGSVALQNLPLEQIERIEFCSAGRAPASTVPRLSAAMLSSCSPAGAADHSSRNQRSAGGGYGTLEGSAGLQGGGVRARVRPPGEARSPSTPASTRVGQQHRIRRVSYPGSRTTTPPTTHPLPFAAATVFGADAYGTEIEGSFWRADSEVDDDGSFATAVKSRSRSRACRLVHSSGALRRERSPPVPAAPGISRTTSWTPRSAARTPRPGHTASLAGLTSGGAVRR